MTAEKIAFQIRLVRPITTGSNLSGNFARSKLILAGTDQKFLSSLVPQSTIIIPFIVHCVTAIHSLKSSDLSRILGQRRISLHTHYCRRFTTETITTTTPASLLFQQLFLYGLIKTKCDFLQCCPPHTALISKVSSSLTSKDFLPTVWHFHPLVDVSQAYIKNQI